MISEKEITYQSLNQHINLYSGDFMEVSKKWKKPTVIVSDGPYGVSGYPGDPNSPDSLAQIYEPFIKNWSKKSSPVTTLWFWNTEVGWANVHPVLIKNGWEYVSCNIWNKGKAHVAGNVNTKTIRKLPIVTEICAQYVRKAEFSVNGEKISMKKWLRYEWQRSGLPLFKTNEACGVKNAATRKYFTQCDLWYFPPAEAFSKFAAYANEHGKQDGKPYFSLDGKKTISESNWANMRAKFKCPFGITNVWDSPPLKGKERLKNGSKAIHLNQKPIKLMRMLLEMSSEKGDVIWEPFGGLCSTAIASLELKRKCFASEINPAVFDLAVNRMKLMDLQPKLNF